MLTITDFGEAAITASASNIDCVIPENIHIPTTEGQWKF